MASATEGIYGDDTQAKHAQLRLELFTSVNDTFVRTANALGHEHRDLTHVLDAERHTPSA